MKLASTVGVIVQIALRNLLSSRWKTLIVGGIVGFGALLVVLGTSLLDSVDESMSRSIIGSVAGNIQVFSKESKEDLDVMGGFSMDSSPIEPLPDFERVARILESVPNVETVVPMGIDGAIVLSGNTVDQALSRLRETVTRRAESEPSPALEAEYAARKDHVRQILSVLGSDIEKVRQLAADSGGLNEELALMQDTTSDAFWEGFDQEPFARLELLENRVAPLASDADMLFLRYVGTDPAAFAQAFDRMTIVDGEPIPPGRRGFLFSKYVYEEQVKLKTARGLDKIREARENRGATIATDEELGRLVREGARGVRELLLQLDAPKTEDFRKKLQAELNSDEADVGKLLEQFLTLTDETFDRRYAFFYEQLAPSLELYRVRIGDTLTIKAFTRSGYVQSANLKVYGTFAFKGLEKSPQAGSLNLMDLVSFRELYGFMTAERQAEIAAMRARAGARDVSREDAEDALFGASPSVEAASAGADIDLDQVLSGLAGSRRGDAERDPSYDPVQLERGVILNAAVLLKDETRLDETIREIEAAGEREGVPLKAISWQKAAGLVGQFTVLMRVVLYTAVLIIFVVALVIINNALVMATLERVREIGTLRAIGAQRRFILSMLVLESIVVGVLFGALGAALGAGITAALGKVGIPAFNDVFMFFFSGPKLYPAFNVANLLAALIVVLLVSIISSVYPAWIAMRVSPVQAMQSED